MRFWLRNKKTHFLLCTLYRRPGYSGRIFNLPLTLLKDATKLILCFSIHTLTYPVNFDKFWSESSTTSIFYACRSDKVELLIFVVKMQLIDTRIKTPVGIGAYAAFCLC